MKNYKRRKYSIEDRAKCADLFDEGYGFKSVAKRFGICKDTVRKWFYVHQALGREELLKVGGPRVKYTFQQKVAAAQAIVDEGMTKQEAMARFKIRSESSLRKWCLKYREGGKDALRPRRKGRPVGAKTQPKAQTREEELEAKVRYLEAEVAYLKKLSALVEENNL